jgi:hypothetical protein
MKTACATVAPATPNPSPLLDTRRFWVRVPRILQSGLRNPSALSSPFMSPANAPFEVDVTMDGSYARLPWK